MRLASIFPILGSRTITRLIKYMKNVRGSDAELIDKQFIKQSPSFDSHDAVRLEILGKVRFG